MPITNDLQNRTTKNVEVSKASISSNYNSEAVEKYSMHWNSTVEIHSLRSPYKYNNETIDLTALFYNLKNCPPSDEQPRKIVA